MVRRLPHGFVLLHGLRPRRTAYAIKRRQLRDLSRLSSRLGGRSARSERVCPVRLAALWLFAKVHHSALFFMFFACRPAARHFFAWSDERRRTAYAFRVRIAEFTMR